MKAAFRFCKPGSTSDNFASMTVEKFEGLPKCSIYADIELKSWI